MGKPEDDQYGEPIFEAMCREGYPNVLGPEFDIPKVPIAYSAVMDAPVFKTWIKKTVSEIEAGGAAIDKLFDEQTVV